MKTYSRIMIVPALACLILLGAATSQSQTTFTFKVYCEDASGWKDSVTLGASTLATDGIGDSLSPELNEKELPPLPPSGIGQAPDVRVMDPTGVTGVPPYGQGVDVDLRELTSLGRRHVFRVKFRRDDPDGSIITLSWPSGLGILAGGGFYVTDGFGGFFFDPVDMTTQTSYGHATFNGLSGSFVDIVVGDGTVMRTFERDSIAMAADSKGKVGKAEKRKPYEVDYEFNLTTTHLSSTLTLSLGIISDIEVTFPGDTTGRLPINQSGLKEYENLSLGSPLDSGRAVHVVAHGYKGKAPKVKYNFDADDDVEMTVFKAGFPALRLKMPNINNIGEEIYVQGTAITIGFTSPVYNNLDGDPVVKNITHPKWKDVTKTMRKFKNVNMLQNGPAQCLDTLKGKEVKKLLKSLPPDKTIRYSGSPVTGNKLLGELVAFKVNLAASLKAKTAQGLGELIYRNGALPYGLWDGWTLNEIAVSGDSAIACVSPYVDDSLGRENMASLLAMLNGTFAAAFDTTSFGQTQIGKGEGGTVATGVKAVALVPYLEGSGATFEPVPYHDYSNLYDVPVAFSLLQNYPNPFNPTTTIEFTIPDDAIVTLKVYNMLGQEVATLLDREEMSAGENWTDWDAASLSTGVYYYRIDVNEGQFKQVKKMMLIK